MNPEDTIRALEAPFHFIVTKVIPEDDEYGKALLFFLDGPYGSKFKEEKIEKGKLFGEFGRPELKRHPLDIFRRKRRVREINRSNLGVRIHDFIADDHTGILTIHFELIGKGRTLASSEDIYNYNLAYRFLHDMGPTGPRVKEMITWDLVPGEEK